MIVILLPNYIFSSYTCRRLYHQFFNPFHPFLSMVLALRVVTVATTTWRHFCKSVKRLQVPEAVT